MSLKNREEFTKLYLKLSKLFRPAYLLPSLAANLFSFILIFFRPVRVPVCLVVMCGICSVIVILTTFFLEIPKYKNFDTDSFSTNLIKVLININVLKITFWTLGSLLLLLMTGLHFEFIIL
ncbi:MAG: hypothetical protein SFU25_08140 [Candidatus Caenarcaniphilales bacterium]|nr:hypothetical protein [Candidatus Caenarcaniphilales bacterium]